MNKTSELANVNSDKQAVVLGQHPHKMHRCARGPFDSSAIRLFISKLTERGDLANLSLTSFQKRNLYSDGARFAMSEWIQVGLMNSSTTACGPSSTGPLIFRKRYGKHFFLCENPSKLPTAVMDTWIYILTFNRCTFADCLAMSIHRSTSPDNRVLTTISTMAITTKLHYDRMQM